MQKIAHTDTEHPVDMVNEFGGQRHAKRVCPQFAVSVGRLDHDRRAGQQLAFRRVIAANRSEPVEYGAVAAAYPQKVDAIHRSLLPGHARWPTTEIRPTRSA